MDREGEKWYLLYCRIKIERRLNRHRKTKDFDRKRDSNGERKRGTDKKKGNGWLI